MYMWCLGGPSWVGEGRIRQGNIPGEGEKLQVPNIILGIKDLDGQ